MSAVKHDPVEIYRQCLALLLANGWYRDGDDPGIWRHGTDVNPPGQSFEDALATQFIADGIDFAWTT